MIKFFLEFSRGELEEKKMRRIWSLIPFFLVGCSSTIDFHVPTQNFMTPEVEDDEFSFRTQLSFQNSTRFELASLERGDIFDDGSGLVDTEQGTVKDNLLTGMLGLGLSNTVEVFYRAYADSPDVIGAKLQILGRTGQPTRGPKLAVWMGGGSSEYDNDTFSPSSLTGDTREYTYESEGFIYEVGVVAGFRLNSKVLPYLSAAFRRTLAESRLTSDTFENLTIKNQAIIKNVVLGLQTRFDSGTYFMFEGGYASSEWKGIESRDDYSLGISIGQVYL